MSESVFDRLQKRLEVQKYEEGISALEIAQLPPALRKIIRLMLREIEMTYSAICEAMEAMTDPEKLNNTQLDEALETLTSQGWLIQRGEGDHLNYTVNLRRKQGSNLADSFWGKLDQKIAKNKEGKQD
jgi:hypothetical protein